MRNIVPALASAGLLGASLLTATAAHAVEPAGSTSLGCTVGTYYDGVRVHTDPNTTSTVTGLMYSGDTAPAACSTTTGGTYTACGVTDSKWINIQWNGRLGYVASACMRYGA